MFNILNHEASINYNLRPSISSQWIWLWPGPQVTTKTNKILEKKNHSFTVDGSVNYCGQYGGSSKKFQAGLPYGLAVLFLGIHRDMCTLPFTGAALVTMSRKRMYIHRSLYNEIWCAKKKWNYKVSVLIKCSSHMFCLIRKI